MPIRTNRGRAAVYRKVWGWPLRSPRHLVGAILIVAVVAVAIAISIARSQGQSPRGERDRAAPLSAPSVTVTEPSVDPSDLPNRVTSVPPPSSAPPAPEALSVAEQWAKAWVNHPQGATNQQWVAGLRPYTTPDFLPELGSVDPANVPAKKVTGKASATQSYGASVMAKVPTDGGAIKITVIKTDRGWRVADYSKG